jgi:DNA-binding transcriptional LysR family regulator
MKTFRNLSLKQLQAVAAISKCGTITRAARELHVTPAALTARMKQLEGDTGLTMFDRTARGLRPTEAGRELLSAIDKINVIIDGCAERLSAANGLHGGRVTLAVVSTAKYFTPKVIAEFARSHPSVEIRLSVGNRDSTIGLLRDYSVDLAIMGRPPHDFAVRSDPFGKHPFVIIASPHHKLAGRRNLSKMELANESFLAREEGSGTRNVFEQFVGPAMGRPTQFGVEIDSNETIKQAVMANLGIALISAHTIAAEVEDGRLIVLDVNGSPIWRQWFAVRRSDKTLGPAAEELWQFITKVGGRWLPQFRDRKRQKKNSNDE